MGNRITCHLRTLQEVKTDSIHGENFQNLVTRNGKYDLFVAFWLFNCLFVVFFTCYI